MTPWFDENTFGALFGTIVGGGGGTLIGLWGAMAGTLASQGRGRGLVLGIAWVIVGLGVLLACAGLYALAAGQPFHIWFWPCQVGFISTVVVGCLIPVIRQRYAEAEGRRLQAEQFRAR
jgi:hypothetical protein